MFRQVCMVSAVLVAAVALNSGVVDTADASFTGTKKLRTFQVDELENQQYFFVLAFPPEGGERFERYFFRLESGTSISALHMQVRPVNGVNPASPEVICEGWMSETLGFDVNKNCDAIRPGHHYRIDTRSTVPTTLVLYGFDPIGTPQTGNGGQPLCWIGFC